MQETHRGLIQCPDGVKKPWERSNSAEKSSLVSRLVHEEDVDSLSCALTLTYGL